LITTVSQTQAASSGLKRKAAEECKNCKGYYQVDDNTKKRCRYHPCKLSPALFRFFNTGSLCLHYFLALVARPEVDSSSKTWCGEHDYRVHGVPEELVDDPTWKDGFMVPCCYKEPYESGCVVSRHEPKVNTVGNKRVRR
jgi:hypothetical protein